MKIFCIYSELEPGQLNHNHVTLTTGMAQSNHVPNILCRTLVRPKVVHTTAYKLVQFVISLLFQHFIYSLCLKLISKASDTTIKMGNRISRRTRWKTVHFVQCGTKVRILSSKRSYHPLQISKATKKRGQDDWNNGTCTLGLSDLTLSNKSPLSNLVI